MWETLTEGAKWFLTPQVFMVLGALLTVFVGWKVTKLLKSGIVSVFLLAKNIGIVGVISSLFLLVGTGSFGFGLGELASYESTSGPFTNQELLSMESASTDEILRYSLQREGMLSKEQIAEEMIRNLKRQDIDPTQLTSLINYVSMPEAPKQVTQIDPNQNRVPISTNVALLFVGIAFALMSYVTYTRKKEEYCR